MRLKVAIVCVCLMVGLLILSLVQLKVGFALDMPSPSWRTKTAMPTARGQVSVIAGDEGLIYVMGGFNGSDPPMTTVEAYDPLTDSWSTKAPIPNATRGAAVAKGPDGAIYVISGGNGTIYSATVQAYNTTSNTWSKKTSIPLTVWMAGAATSNGGKIHVFGGESQAGALFSNKTQIYDPSTDTWTNGTDMPTARGLLGVVKGPDDLIYAIGGYNGTVLSVVEAYNPSTDTWTEKAPMPSPKLEFGVVLGPDEKIYVIGGGTNYVNNAGPFFFTVEIYDPKKDVWIMPSWWESILPTARKELGAATGSNGRIYAIGGANGAYVNANEEALVVLPENIAPTAYIESITPNPAVHGETISFVGYGTDPDGSIAAYNWRSSIDGSISSSATFSLSTLTDGMHTVYFSVKDNSGVWSQEAGATVTVNKPLTEDPLFQELLSLNETLNDRINDLSQQNTNLRIKVDTLSQQNDDLSSEVDTLSRQNGNLTDLVGVLTQKIDLMTIVLLGASVVIMVLVFVPIALRYVPVALRYVRKRRSSSV